MFEFFFYTSGATTLENFYFNLGAQGLANVDLSVFVHSAIKSEMRSEFIFPFLIGVLLLVCNKRKKQFVVDRGGYNGVVYLSKS